ncbi:MAG: MBL fold metallo-hydrolase [Clostridia bacterium]|nr:MBL fold metallo-hydrolase [Clostridia bacterium]
MKKLLILLLCLMLPCAALAEGCIVNLIDDPAAEYAFQPGAEVLEIVFPQIYGCDACILRMGGEVMLLDAGTDHQSPIVAEALQLMGIDHIDIAFNSHPHDDHITGFEFVPETASIGKLLVAFDRDYNNHIKRTAYHMDRLGIPMERIQDGDVLTLGGAELTVIQRTGTMFTTNDMSATLMLQYGARRMFFAGDLEIRGETRTAEQPPVCGLKADILKYPHHGHWPMRDKLFSLIQPELVIVTAHEYPAREGFEYLKQKGVPGLSTYHGIIRLRTDGEIWVVDYLPREV